MKFKICMIMLFLNCGLQASNSDLENLEKRESFVRDQTPLACRKGLVEIDEAALAAITYVTEFKARLGDPNLTKDEFRTIRAGLKRYFRYFSQGKKIDDATDIVEKNHERILPFIPNHVPYKVFKKEQFYIENVVGDVLKVDLQEKLKAAQVKQGQVAYNPSAPVLPEVQTATLVSGNNNCNNGLNNKR